MNTGTDISSQQNLKLENAILLYGDGTFGGHARATLHPILPLSPLGEDEIAAGQVAREPKRPEMGPGTPLSRETLRKICDELSGADPTRHVLLPPKAFCSDQTLLAWHAPAQRRTIHFSTADKAFNAAVSGKRVPHPPLLFLASPGRLRVFALQSDARPEPQTPLMVAPYCNLYSGGAMCAGTVKLPGRLAVEDIPHWEAAFYDSAFTHSNLSDKMTGFKGGHHALWRAMAKPKPVVRVFPVEHLLPAKLTLEKAVSK